MTFNKDTPLEVQKWLETSKDRRQRIRIFYGNDGKCWNDENDVLGIVGNSNGSVKIPLLIHNSRSMGGGAILDHCIVRIDTKNSQNKIVTVYKDANTTFDTFTSTSEGEVYNGTELYARCKNEESGKNLASFMNGTRWRK